MAKRHSASSASAAAELQKTLGRIPAYLPKMKKAAASALAARERASREAAAALLEDAGLDVHELKLSVCEKYGISFLKNSEILRFIPDQKGKSASFAATLRNSPIAKRIPAVRALLLKSPTRTLSGISPIALMPLPALCGGHCVYCPRVKGAPHSYTGYEPTTMRAIQNRFSAGLQVRSRICQYGAQGHATDKCHLIVMGGTFLYPGVKESYRFGFMKEAFDTLNGKEPRSTRRRPSASLSSLRESIDANESAPHRAIGVTFETRPDFGFEKEADAMLSMGGTQVELGVQALSDRVYSMARRGHTVADVIRSTRILKDSGFKLCYHMMPGLFSKPSEDIGYFKTLFSSQDFQPDMLKIYPVLVLQGTPLYNLWKRDLYHPYETDEAAEVIAKATRFIPPYVRVPRIQRDIPVPLISAGVKNSNLRQIVDEKLKEMGVKCRCIRCREVGSEERRGHPTGKLNLSLKRIDYKASGGKEIFLSYEDTKKDLLAGFLRLRIPKESHRPELDGTSSIVRELHVYGQEAAIGEDSPGKQQHKGLGMKLLAEAEEITKKEFGYGRITVISGPGARGYYRKHGYLLNGPYMAKRV